MVASKGRTAQSIRRRVSLDRSRRYCPFGSRERLRQIIAGGSLSQAVLMTRAQPLPHEHLHRRQQTKPRANVPTLSLPFSTTPSPLQSGQVFHTRRTIC